MKKVWAMKWAKALESGEYEQAKHSLKAGDGFCCLGVLCDISNAGKWNTQEYYFTGKDHESVVPPREVCDLVGMKHPNGELPKGTVYKTVTAYLSGLNDEKNYDFKEVAKVIRKYWKEL